MNFRRAFPRSLSIMLMLVTLAAAGGPVLTASAASPHQAGTESWGTFQLPAPEEVRVAMSSSAPLMSPQQLTLQNGALKNNELPGPSTPAGADTTTRAAAPIDPEVDLTGNNSVQSRTNLNGVNSSPPGTFTIFKNSSLAGAPTLFKSDINEPSAASSGPDIFSSFNWYAGLSKDYGGSWTYVNPFTTFGSLHGGFCCDQDVIYDPGHDLTLWELLYVPDSTGNAVRLAVSKGQANLEAGAWYSYVITSPESYCVGGAVGDFFDFPHLALTNNYLYVLMNIFSSTSVFRCTTVLRLSLSEISAGGGLTVGTYFSSTGFNFTAAQGGADTLFFARHEDTTHLRVYSWPESDNGSGVATGSVLVANASYLVGPTYNCTVTGFTNPCGFEDDRLKAGWLRRANNELGFMWAAPQGTDGAGTFAFPYTRMLTMDATTKGSVHESAIWNSGTAMFLPSSGVNARGHVGGTIAFAGGATAPNCAAWIYDDYTAFDTLDFSVVTAGTGAPGGNRWGDFLRTRPDGANPYEWQGTCYAIESGTLTPRVVRFGRAREEYAPAGKYDDSDPRWTYDANWVPYAIPGAYNNTVHIGVAAGATTSFSFIGDRFVLSYVRYSILGTIAMFLDGSGTPFATINTNGSAGLVSYTSPPLIPGPHTLTLLHSGPPGTLIAIDALEVMAPTYLPSGTYDDQQPGWIYSGTWMGFSVPGPYSNTLTIGISPGTASFAFSGTGFSLTYLQYTSTGSMDVFVDGGGPVATINTVGSPSLATYNGPALVSGQHVVTFVVKAPPGSMVGLDKITILP